MAKVKSHEWRGEPARYAHLKLDGMFVRVSKNSTFYCDVETSHPTDITQQLYTHQTYLFGHIPVGMIVLGELVVPGHPCSEVKSALANDPSRLEFRSFAIERMPGVHQSILTEAPLDEVEACLKDWGVRPLPFIVLKDGWNPDDVKAWGEDQGGEGVMLKDGNLLNWRKLKRNRTIDLVIRDQKDGKGKFVGLIGALVCGLADGTIVANVGGMDDATRVELSLNWESYVGRVIEVRYQEIGAKGRLRHPRFVQVRDDKHPDECVADQDPQLASILSRRNR